MSDHDPNQLDSDPSSFAALYALDALEGDELRQFERYLEENPEARHQVDEFTEAAARLSMLSAVEAPGAIRERVLGELGAIRQEPQRLAARVDRRGPARTVFLAAAAAVVVVVAGLVGYSLRSPGPAASGELATVLSASDVRVSGMDSTSGLSGGLIYSESEGRAVVVAGDLPDAPDGQVYQLWRVRGDEAVSAGTLARPDNGPAQSVVDEPLRSGDVVAVTIEPGPGAQEPTLPVVLSAEI